MKRNKPLKERVITARVPEGLDEQIKKKAEGLGLSVSNLVRNVLQNTFGLVEGIVADTRDIARSARGEAGAADAPLGWQEVTLNVNAVCGTCNEILARGTRGAVGVGGNGGAAKQFLCLDCLAELGPSQEKTA